MFKKKGKTFQNVYEENKAIRNETKQNKTKEMVNKDQKDCKNSHVFYRLFDGQIK